MLFSILKTVRRRLGLALVLIGAVALPSQASAATVLFTLTGPTTASFSLDQSPTPTNVNFNNFSIDGVSGTLSGAPASLFLTFDTGGKFVIATNQTTFTFLSIQGSLFSGLPADPTFIVGSYNPAELGVSSGADYQLSITDVSAVPEPSTWMLMLVGFGVVGGSMRLARNRKKLDLRSA